MKKKNIKIVISDCHLGTGAFLPDGGLNPLEEFRKDEKFVEFLEHFTTGEFKGANVELVINGDFFDMLTARTSHDMPYEIIESIAVYKIRRILRGHPKVVKALAEFIEKGHQVKYIWGNHDAGLWWPGVREEITQSISPKIEFMFDAYEFDSIRIEHGHQYEIFHQFETENIFIKSQGRTVLNYPFGSFFVAGFLAKIKLKRHYISQVVPFGKFLRWAFIFDFWFAVIHGFKACWFFISMRLIYHPYRFAKLSKTLHILREIIYRPKFEKIAIDVLNKHGAKVLILGHNHQATHRYYQDGRQYLNTGTWTDITSFDPGTLGRMSKATFAYIEYPDGVEQGQGVAPRVSLRVWKGKHKDWDEFEI